MIASTTAAALAVGLWVGTRRDVASGGSGTSTTPGKPAPVHASTPPAAAPDDVRPAPATLPAAPERPVVTRWTVFLSEADAATLGLSAEEAAAVARACADASSKLMGQIAVYGSFEKTSASERTVTVALPEDVSRNLESEFRRQLETELRPETLARLTSNDGISRRISASLLHFGRYPMGLSFESADRFESAERYRWTHVIDSRADVQQATFLSGNLSRAGFREVYGPVADRVLFKM